MVMDIILMVEDIHWLTHFIPVKGSDLVKFISMRKKTGLSMVIKVLLEIIIYFTNYIAHFLFEISFQINEQLMI